MHNNYVTRTVFTVTYLTIGKPAVSEVIDVVAADMEEAIHMVRECYGNPKIGLVQDKGHSALVKDSVIVCNTLDPYTGAI